VIKSFALLGMTSTANLFTGSMNPFPTRFAAALRP
jgi:hypothetical protein